MEPFKQWINIEVIQGMALHFVRHSKDFNAEEFIAQASDNLENLELKARTTQLARVMNCCLPSDFPEAAVVIQQSLGPVLAESISGGEVNSKGIGGWALMALADYVGLYGQGHFDVSMNLLQQITRRGSVEFAIRYFSDRTTEADTCSIGILGTP